MTRNILIIGHGQYAGYISQRLSANGVESYILSKDHERVIECKGVAGNFNIITQKQSQRKIYNAAGIIIAENTQREANFSLYNLIPSDSIISLSTLPPAPLSQTLPPTPLSLKKRGGQGGEFLKKRGGQGAKIVFLTGIAAENCVGIMAEVIENAIKLQSDGAFCYILTRNIKVAADGLERRFQNARESGVVFVKFTDTQPEIRQNQAGTLYIEFFDEITRKKFSLTPDITVLDETIKPSDYLSELAAVFSLHTDTTGFIQTDNVHRFPVLTNRKGIFAAGPARGMLLPDDLISDAENAVMAVMKEMINDECGIKSECHHPKAEIMPGQCVRCLTCYRLCPYRAIVLNSRPVIMPDACEGCGICRAECPRQAILIPDKPKSYDQTIKSCMPRITAFCCERSAAQAHALASCTGHKLPSGLSIIQVPCAGSISLDNIFSAFLNGAEGVMILTCHEGNCHSEYGNIFARNRAAYVSDALERLGNKKDRLMTATLSSNMGAEFARIVTEFEEKLKS